MAPSNRTEYSKKKVNYFNQLNGYMNDYDKIARVCIDNVTSQQFHKIRRELRAMDAQLIVGKKTQLKKCLKERWISTTGKDERAWDESCDNNTNDSKEKTVIDMCELNCGFIFTNADLVDVKVILTKHRINAPARIGSISPIDVTVPAGNTGLPPDETKFFQALQLQTKIEKGTVAITQEKQVLEVGQKVDSSTSALLGKLKIFPFYYGLEMALIYDNGAQYGSEVLDMGDDEFASATNSAIANLTAVSLGLGYPSELAFPHMVMNAFKDLLAVSLETDYDFDQFNGKDLKTAIKEGKVTAAAPTTTTAAVAEKVVEAEKTESEEEGLGGLFD